MSKMEGVSRIVLKDAVPLETPLAVNMHINSKCNFRCNFCAHALDKEEFYNLGIREVDMPMEIYMTAIDQLRAFPGRVKTLNLAGAGEPLLHPEIAEMVRYAKKQEIAERVEVVTNASALTPDLSDKLIEAGLDRLRVSIEGVDDNDYACIGGVKQKGIFARIVDNLAYFFKNKMNTSVYIKTMDIVVEKKEKKDYFYDIFTPISDHLGVEYVIPANNRIDYGRIKNDYSRGVRGNSVLGGRRCPSPFYTLAIAADGAVWGCCYYPIPIIYGNVMKESLRDIWKGEKRRNFLCGILTKTPLEICQKCKAGIYLAQPEDYIDDEAAEKIIDKIID